MKRYCPQCKKELSSNSNYFCINCQLELPDDLIQVNESVKRITVFNPSIKGHVILRESLKSVLDQIFLGVNPKILLLIVLLFVLLGIPSYIFLTKFSPLKKSISSENMVSQKNVVVNPKYNIKNGVELKSHIFGSDKITTYIPSTVDFYLEANDFREFSKYFTEVNPDFIPFIEQLDKMAGDHFAIFIKKSEEQYFWTLVVLENTSRVEMDSLELPELDWLFYEKVGDCIVVSTRKEDIDQVKNVFSGLEISIDKSSTYASSKVTASKSGKIFMVSLTPAGKSFVSELHEMSIPADINFIVESYINLKNDYLVIL